MENNEKFDNFEELGIDDLTPQTVEMPEAKISDANKDNQ